MSPVAPRVFGPGKDFLIVVDLAVERELCQAGCRRLELGDVVEDDEARPSQAPREDFALGARAGGNGRPGGVRGGPTLDDSSVQSHGADGGVGDRTTGLVAEKVGAFRPRPPGPRPKD